MIRRLGLFRMLCRVDWGAVKGEEVVLPERVGGEDADVAVDDRRVGYHLDSSILTGRQSCVYA